MVYRRRKLYRPTKTVDSGTFSIRFHVLHVLFHVLIPPSKDEGKTQKLIHFPDFYAIRLFYERNYHFLLALLYFTNTNFPMLHVLKVLSLWIKLWISIYPQKLHWTGFKTYYLQITCSLFLSIRLDNLIVIKQNHLS